MPADVPSTTAKPRLGPWLVLLAVQTFLWMTPGFNIDGFRQLIPPTPRHGMPFGWEVATWGGMVMAVLLLAWRRAVTLWLFMLASILSWLFSCGLLIDRLPPALFEIFPGYLQLSLIAPSLLGSLMIMLAWFNYLLTSPRIQALYPGWRLGDAGQGRLMRFAGGALILGLPVWTCCMMLPRLVATVAGPDLAATLMRIDARPLPLVALIECGLIIAAQLIAGGLLWHRRDQRGRNAMLVALWLLVLDMALTTVLARGAPDLSAAAFGQALRIEVVVPLVVAWSAVLLDTPFVRRRDIVDAGRKNEVTDVDRG